MKVKVKLCLTLSDPMDCSLPGSSIHGIFQARVLEWGAISFSREECLTYKKLAISASCCYHWKLLLIISFNN